MLNYFQWLSITKLTKGVTLPYDNSHIAETAFTIAGRLRGVSSQTDLYALSYLARTAHANGTTNDFEKTIEAAAQGDKDIALCIESAIARSDLSFEDITSALASLDGSALDAYLGHGPVAQNVFSGASVTPKGVARLALAILDIQPGEKVVDYGCGQGNFLEAAAEQCPEADYLGVEANPGTLAAAKIRSKVRGSQIEYALGDMFCFYEDSIAGSPVAKAFSNYPWGMRTMMFEKSSGYIEKVLKGQERYRRPTSADWVFNRLLVDSLKEDGTAVAVMSNGACFNGIDKPVREYFVKNGFIEAVVALPKGVFAPYTMIQTSLVVLCPGGAEGVRFVDATDLGTSDRRSCSIDDAAIETILGRLNEDSEKSALKTIDEVAARNFDLSAKRYLEKEIKVPNGIALGSVAKITRGASIRAAELDKLVCDEDTGLSYLNLKNISDGYIDDELPNLCVLDPKLERHCIHNGDVLVSKNGAPFKVAVAEIPKGRKVLANGNLYVLSVETGKINPYYLAAFLCSPSGKELLAREAVGTAIPNIPVRALSEIKVPLEDADRQKAVADAYLAKTDEIKVLKLQLSRARQEISDLFDEEG